VLLVVLETECAFIFTMYFPVVRDWSPDFYVEVAYSGMIAVTMDDVLLPEMQREYCVLDWKYMHICKRVGRELRRTREKAKLRLTFDSAMDAVFQVPWRRLLYDVLVL